MNSFLRQFGVMIALVIAFILGISSQGNNIVIFLFMILTFLTNLLLNLHISNIIKNKKDKVD